MAAVTVLVGAVVMLLGGAGPAAAQSGGAPTGAAGGKGGVDVVKVDGLIDPIMLEYLRTSIQTASRSGSVAVVLTVDSEGAVVSDGELADLVRLMRTSAVPVDVWVGPSNSSGTGRAAYLLAGGRTVGVAPGARIGAAPAVTPVLSQWVDPGSALGRAGLFGEGSRTIGFQEARDLGIAAADAPTVLEFLANVPGFETKEKTVDGRTTREPVTQVRFTQLDLVHQLFHAVAGPSSAYLLLVIGLGVLLFELFTAGVGVAGIVGASTFVMGCYGLAALPTRPAAVAALVLAFVAFGIDVQTGVPRFWTGAGLALFAIGSLTLFAGGDGVAISWITLAAATGGVLLAFFSGMPSMVRTRFSTPTIGREWMIGELGLAITDVAPDGVVQIRGASWRAFTNRATPIEQLDRVRVIGIEGLVLEVEPEEGGARDYRERRPRGEQASEEGASGADSLDGAAS